MFKSKKGQELNEKLEKFADYLLISLMWFVYSIPIFTIGAAISATYATNRRCIQNKEGYVIKNFHRAFMDSFKQATIIWMFYLFMFSMLLLNTNLLTLQGTMLWLNQAVQLFLMIMLTLTLPYVFFCLGYIARFTDSLKTVCTNNLVFLSIYKKQAVLVWLILMSTCLILWLIPLAVVILPSVMIQVASNYTEAIYSKYLPQ